MKSAPASYKIFRSVIVLMALLQAAISATSQDVRDQVAQSFGERQVRYASMAFALCCLRSRMTPETESAGSNAVWFFSAFH
jgi:hypothetical protein